MHAMSFSRYLLVSALWLIYAIISEILELEKVAVAKNVFECQSTLVPIGRAYATSYWWYVINE